MLLPYHSLDEANITIMLWAIKSMNSHHFDKVIWAIEAGELVEALERPETWPFLSSDLGIKAMLECFCKLEDN